MYAKSIQRKDTQSFVRQMAKQFEQIGVDSTVYTSSHEANFRQCNWWLEMPSSVTCFDDLAHDPHEQVNSQNLTEANTVHEIETAEIANEFQTMAYINAIEHRRPESSDQSSWTNSLISTASQISSSSSGSSTSTPSRTSQTSQTSITSSSSTSSGQITNTVEELLYNEETYIRALNHGIDGYMKNFNRNDMPSVLRGQQYRIFGNVHRIKDFHENIFFPALKQCNMDIVKICNTFCDFIKKDYFYIYILYAINHQKSEKICIAHKAYFKQIQNEIGDKLGVNSFLVQPIQRLPKYKLLLGQLFSELGKRFGVHDDSIKNELGACCLAEKRIQRLLDTLNGSMNINDIVDCELHTLCQGKFIAVDRFDIGEKSEQRRRYKGKVFLFEKCIIYTEQSSKNKLLYRGNFRHATLGFTFEDQRNYFRLYNERKGNQEIEFTADAQTIQLWIQMLNRTMAVVMQEEKNKIKETRKSSIKNELSPLQVLLRTTHTVTGLHEFAFSSNQIDGGESSSGESQRNAMDYTTNADAISIKSGRSLDSQLCKTTKWYTELDHEFRSIERFHNSEKFYNQLLRNAITTYLTDMPDDVRASVEKFLKAINRIVKFHTDTFHPQLLHSEMKATVICDLIKTHLDNLELNVYVKYAAYVHDALQIIRNFHSENSRNEAGADSFSEIESLLLMPINHITVYATFLEGLLNEYKARDLLAEDFKTIAAVEIEMKKLQKMVTENYTLNSMKGTASVVWKFGLITYSDEISIDFSKCRIMILEKGLVCARIRLSTKTKKEKFIDQVFSIPILNIELHENDAYPRKMKITAENVSHINYTITFATTRKKKQFMFAIRTQRNSPSKRSTTAS